MLFLAFINADWRDFQNTPTKNEIRVNSILVNDYLRILNQSGWQETHIFKAPRSSEHFKDEKNYHVNPVYPV